MNFSKPLHLGSIMVFALINGFIFYLFLLGLPYGIEPFLASLAHWDRLSPRIGIVAVIACLAALGGGLLPWRLPADWKNGLLYMRWHFPHPAHDVFLTTRRQPFESSVVLAALPEVRDAAFSARVQTEVWRRLYRKHAKVPLVMNTRLHWRMLRDLYILSLFFLLLFFAGWLVSYQMPFVLVALYLFMYGAQFLFLMLAARRVGCKFVDNVLAVELGLGEGGARAGGRDKPH
ncbi:MAG: hypothetical protein ABFS23_10360, partial [Pseudomonadota bacterium]